MALQLVSHSSGCREATTGATACPTNIHIKKSCFLQHSVWPWPSLTCTFPLQPRESLCNASPHVAWSGHHTSASSSNCCSQYQLKLYQIWSLNSHMPKPNAVSKWFELLVSYFLESNRVQAMGMLLQINGAQMVWDPLLDSECKNLHKQCLLAENLWCSTG